MTTVTFLRDITLILLGCMLFVTSTSAQVTETDEQLVFKLIKADWFLEIMDAEGYSAEKDADGDIEWKIDGFKAWIVFPDSETHILFISAFGGTEANLRKVNTWNSEVIYSRSYIDENGNPKLEYPLRTKSGVTKEQARDYLSLCRDIFSEWVVDVIK